MSRLIFVPQLPVKMRYSEWWFTELPSNLRLYFDSVIILGMNMSSRWVYDGGFSLMKDAIKFESDQMDEFMQMEIQDDDILLLADLSFPGLFSNVLFHKKVRNCFAICHATSLNAYDYFAPVRRAKWKVESGHAKLFKKVFVASDYSKSKLLGWDNVVNLGALPNPPFPLYVSFWDDKDIDIVSAARVCRQKVNRGLEKLVENYFGVKILRTSSCTSWKDYFLMLLRAKVLLVTSSEECYGYQCVDAVLNGCVPVAPRKFAYPEILSDGLYDTDEELVVAIDRGLTGMIVPALKNIDRIGRFYANLAREMHGE